MKVLSIDPGTCKSAYIIGNNYKIIGKGIIINDNLLNIDLSKIDVIVIENFQSYGMPIGVSSITTIFWIGRYFQKFTELNKKVELVFRKDIKMHHCHTMRAKDSNIRQVLLDRWGGREKAMGLKKTQGPLYGISKDLWSALAILVFYLDTHKIKIGEQQ